MKERPVWEWIKEISVHFDRYKWLHIKESTFDYSQVMEEYEEILSAINNNNFKKLDI